MMNFKYLYKSPLEKRRNAGCQVIKSLLTNSVDNRTLCSFSKDDLTVYINGRKKMKMAKI